MTQVANTNKNNKDNKFKMLILSLLFDVIGMASYIIPGAGELIDIIWAPISGMLLYKMYPGKVGKVASIIGFIEEAIPGLDIIPTFTITWFYTYIFSKNK